MKSGEKPKTLKINNTRIVLDMIRRRSMITIAEISETIKLSKTTVKKIIDNLLDVNLVIPAGKGDSTEEGGKKPELYRFNRNFGYIISIHITPDEMICVTTDLDAEITWRRTLPIPHDCELPCILQNLASLIRECMDRKEGTGERLLGVVIPLPGLVDIANGVSIYSPHYPSWGRDVPFVSQLRGVLGEAFSAPISIDGVNRFQAMAERARGAASGVSNFIVIDALDEGLGSGIVFNGRIMQGHQSLSGEIGHMTVDPVDGERCICGNNGCFEAMVSAKRILRLVRRAHADGVDSVLFRSLDAASVRLEDVCAGAAAGDEFCRTVIADAARWFIVGLGNIVMVHDPELIVIQGRYVKAGEYFLKLLRDGVRTIGLPLVEKRVRIEYSVMGEDRGVIGGALCAISDYFEKRLDF